MKIARIITVFFFLLQFSLLYSQTAIEDFNHFTPERSQVLSKMGAFFDETIRKNFPAETDILSHQKFINCFWQTRADGFQIVLNIDRAKLNEINQMLFEDHNYYFFYAHEFGDVQRKKYIITPELNRNGYIKVVPEDNPLVKHVKESFALAGALSPTSYAIVEEMPNELSQTQVKEYLAIIYWKYLCILGGIDLVERKPFCETCDL